LRVWLTDSSAGGRRQQCLAGLGIFRSSSLAGHARSSSVPGVIGYAAPQGRPCSRDRSLCGGKLAGDVADGFAGSDESCDDFILLRRTWTPIIAQVLRICARQQVSSKPRAWAVAAARPQERGPMMAGSRPGWRAKRPRPSPAGGFDGRRDSGATADHRASARTATAGRTTRLAVG